jgi:hypothetical protein
LRHPLKVFELTQLVADNCFVGRNYVEENIVSDLFRGKVAGAVTIGIIR